MNPDVNPVDPQEPIEPTDPQEPVDPVDPVEPTEPVEPDYQGKLNATNRFLKKEGYEFKDGKWVKPAAAPAEPAPRKESKPATLTRDEAIVIAKGFSVEELEHANKVASIEGCSVLEALDKSLFKGWKADRDAAAKREAAQLPVGRGSRASTKKTFDTKGLTDEEHKELFNEKQGG